MKNLLLENITDVINSNCNFVILNVLDYTVPYVQEDEAGNLSTNAAEVINLRFLKEYDKFKKGREILIFEPAIRKAIKKLNRGKKKEERILENKITYPQAANILFLASDKNVNLDIDEAC